LPKVNLGLSLLRSRDIAIGFVLAMPLILSCVSPDPRGAEQDGESGRVVPFGDKPSSVVVEAQRALQMIPEQRARDTVEKVTSVLGLSGDRFLVVDAWARNVKVYKADGSLQRVIGRGGKGPGEFSAALHGAVVIEDSVFVPDIMLRRVTVFDVNTGGVVETFRMPFDPIRGFPLSWVNLGTDRISVSSASVSRSGTGTQFTVSLFEDGDLRPIHTRSVSPSNGREFGRATPILAAGLDGRWFLGDGSRGKVSSYDESGTKLQTFEWVGEAPPEFSNSDFRYLRDVAHAETNQRQRRRWDQVVARVPAEARPRFQRTMDSAMVTSVMSGSYPVFVGLRVDERGRVWIGRPTTIGMMQNGPYELEWNDLKRVASSWDIFGADGEYQETLVMPYAFVLTDIGALMPDVQISDRHWQPDAARWLFHRPCPSGKIAQARPGVAAPLETTN